MTAPAMALAAALALAGVLERVAEAPERAAALAGVLAAGGYLARRLRIRRELADLDLEIRDAAHEQALHEGGHPHEYWLDATLTAIEHRVHLTRAATGRPRHPKTRERVRAHLRAEASGSARAGR